MKGSYFILCLLIGLIITPPCYSNDKDLSTENEIEKAVQNKRPYSTINSSTNIGYATKQARLSVQHPFPERQIDEEDNEEINIPLIVGNKKNSNLVSIYQQGLNDLQENIKIKAESMALNGSIDKEPKAFYNLVIAYMKRANTGINDMAMEVINQLGIEKEYEKGPHLAFLLLANIYEKGKVVNFSFMKARRWCQYAKCHWPSSYEQDPYILNDADCDSDSEDEAEYDYKTKRNQLFSSLSDSKTPYTMVARGVHYLPHVFPTKIARNSHYTKNEVGQPLYSSAAYELIQGKFLNANVCAQQLQKAGEVINKVFQIMRDQHTEQYHLIQEIYSNSHINYHKYLTYPKTAGGKSKKSARVKLAFQNYVTIFSCETGAPLEQGPKFSNTGAVIKSPNVSFTFQLEEAVRYSFGLKSFHKCTEKVEISGPQKNKQRIIIPEYKNATSLLPEYDPEGRPKHIYLGKLYIALFTEEELEKYQPYNVVKNYILENNDVRNNVSSPILKEEEVTFHGFFPEKAIVLTLPVRCPSFVGIYESKSYYQEKYGLNKQTYEQWQKKVIKGELSKELQKKLLLDITYHLTETINGLLKEKYTLIDPNYSDEEE